MLTVEQLNYIRDLLNKELAEIEERNREKMGEMESMRNDSEIFTEMRQTRPTSWRSATDSSA